MGARVRSLVTEADREAAEGGAMEVDSRHDNKNVRTVSAAERAGPREGDISTTSDEIVQKAGVSEISAA